MLGQQSLTAKAKRRRRDGEFASPQLTVSRLGDKDEDVDGIDLKPVQPSDKNIDDLLPIGVGIHIRLKAQTLIYSFSVFLLLHLRRSSLRPLQRRSGPMLWMSIKNWRT